MRVELKASYEVEPDRYFWLREAPDGSELDGLRRQVAAVYSELPTQQRRLSCRSGRTGRTSRTSHRSRRAIWLPGGDFVVVEHDGHLIGMGGIRPNSPDQAEVLRVRVHPAMRRRGVGRLLMTELESRARQLGFSELHLDTTTNQPEALAFYQGIGYHEIGRETRPEWSWTLAYFTKRL